MDNKYIARPCKNCKVIDCVFKGHENDFEVCEDYTVTNGDMIKAMFPNQTIGCAIPITDRNGAKFYRTTINGVTDFTEDWWNAPYKRGRE